jgi:hypothetical protein
MKIHVYDTHVKTTAGQYLHFDVLVDDEHISSVQTYVRSYLTSMGLAPAQITSNSCLFCHSEIANREVQAIINKDGHYILPLSGC